MRIIRKFEKRKIYSSFRDNAWDAGLANVQLISKYNNEFCSLFSVSYIFSKYAWVIPLKGEKGVAITNASQKNFSDPNLKTNKIYVAKGNEFYNRSMK